MLEISLKAARTNAGLSADDVASMVEIHPQTLYKYEKDSSNIPFNLLNELSVIYQVPTDNIFLGKKYDLIRTIELKRKQAI